MMIEWSHSAYEAEEEVVDDIRGDFIFVNLPCSHYSVCSAYCGTLIQFDQGFLIKAEYMYSVIEFIFSFFFGDSSLLIHEI